jgi:beta-1,4-mannosyltransferase
MTHALVFFPDYRPANPYQALLYQHAARDLYPHAGTIADALALHRQRSGHSRVIFHLHWEDAVYRAEPTEAGAWQAAQGFLSDLELFLDAGGALIWTLHNEAPHDGRYLGVHEALSAALTRLADVVHVHSLSALAFARRRLGIDPARLALIQHGNFVSQYPTLGHSVASSRAALGLPAASRVLLLFGRLGSYKGGAELLAAFAAVDDPDFWLIVAGKQVDSLAVVLDDLADSVRARIVVENRFIPPEQVPGLFHTCDMAALPYRSSLTSGTALLALSQGRPVLAPCLPSLAELLADGEDALLYDPGAPEGLRGALERFRGVDDTRLVAMRLAARDKADLFDWRQSGLLFDGLYARTLASLRPQRAPATKMPVTGHATVQPATVQPIRAAADAA